MLLDKVTEKFGHPTLSLTGWLVKKILENVHKTQEINTAKLAQIQPDSTVLEVGFGPGLGLQEAVRYLTDSKGKLYGIDYSEYMHKVASKRLQEQITSGKIPLPDSIVDRVFHCNCFHYWPDLKKGSAELRRVMKPEGLMVTTIRVNTVKKAVSFGLLRGKIWQPEIYMDALQATGFKGVHMKEMEDQGQKFNTIFATASK
uniref:Zgc:194242 n=1 Tax=Erpetoichthys calabaricus TaxID=27687 RepID=A0A8C4T9W8_ERPCA